MSKEEAITKGKRAEQLKADPLLTEALATLKQKQIDAFSGSSPAKSEEREQAYFMLKAIEALEIQLNVFEQNGKFEAAKLK